MQQLIPRKRFEKEILACLQESPVTVLIGARQSGKTTLAQMVSRHFDSVTVFDLERATSRQALSTPELTLSECQGLVVLDEIQRMPDLFATLRPLCDSSEKSAVFLLLGSASPELIRGVSESLAGRSLFIRVTGFLLDEIGRENQSKLWFQGGFPRAYLSSNDKSWTRWMDGFITTFLERDIPQLGIRIPAEVLNRFWMMLAHYHGQVWNSSEMARAMDVVPNTARHYLDILKNTYLVRVLQPWYENIKKRQVKSPKVYLRDSGILHFLLGISEMGQLRSHPRYGASWEGFALEQTLALIGERNCFFWATQRGAELDLMAIRGDKRYGFEYKCTDAPTMTRSMHIALDDLRIEKLYVVYPGKERYRIHEKVEAMPLSLLSDLDWIPIL